MRRNADGTRMNAYSPSLPFPSISLVGIGCAPFRHLNKRTEPRNEGSAAKGQLGASLISSIADPKCASWKVRPECSRANVGWGARWGRGSSGAAVASSADLVDMPTFSAAGIGRHRLLATACDRLRQLATACDGLERASKARRALPCASRPRVPPRRMVRAARTALEGPSDMIDLLNFQYDRPRINAAAHTARY